jgi:glycerophosphoryl diester phosphodiesterase
LPKAEAVRLPEPVGPATAALLRLSRGRIASAACIALVLATLVGAGALHSIDLEDRVQITAHRGGAAHSPENTLAAIRRAIDDGTDWVEIDVQESKDGVVVVAHDSDLKKVAGSGVKIWEATADELRSLDIGSYFDKSFQDERVPTLAEVLQLCKGKSRVNIELKYYGHDQELEQRVVELVEEHQMQSDIVVMSLEARGIEKLKKLRPDWTAGQLIAVTAGDPTRAPADFLAVKTSLATRDFVESAHGREKPVYVWTVNDAATMSAMMGRGVDNIITDDPALARQVLAERAAMSPLERILIEVSLLLGAAPPETADSNSP